MAAEGWYWTHISTTSNIYDDGDYALYELGEEGINAGGKLTYMNKTAKMWKTGKLSAEGQITSQKW